MATKRTSSMLGNEDPNTLKRTRTNPLDHSGEAHPEAHGQHDLAFDNEFSRLIGAIGKEALLRMHQSKVFLSGVKGIGIEIGKSNSSSFSWMDSCYRRMWLIRTCYSEKSCVDGRPFFDSPRFRVS